MLLIISLLFSIFANIKEKDIERPTENAMTVKEIIASQPDKETANTIIAKGAKYLALGDSYTIGQNVPEKERFPAQTAELLKTYNVSIKPPQYIATTGWTTANLLSAIHLEKPEKDFDIVTLLIGVNNQYQHKDFAEYRADFTELLGEAINFAGGRKTRVFVLSIPDYSVTPFVAVDEKAKVSTQIDQFNEINKEISLQNGVSYVDITPSSREAANDLSLIADDGLHPSGKEYATWAAMLAPMVKKVLS